jgi:hypothetical protein
VTEDVTPRDLMNDAARIGGWIRELGSLRSEENLLLERAYKELQADYKSDDRGEQLLSIATKQKVRADRPELVERINFLHREVEAALARGRLIEMAAVAERYAF